jgi:hypothetical protein
LRALVRAYHVTLQGVVLDNDAFRAGLGIAVEVWTKSVNGRLAKLFGMPEPGTPPPSTELQ